MGGRLIVVAAVLVFGCGDDSSAPTTDAATAGANCFERCRASISRCGPATASVLDRCRGICAQSPSEARLRCIDGASCVDLLIGLNDLSLCAN